MFVARWKAWIIKGIFTGIGTLIVASIASHYLGIKSPISISVSLPSFREDPAQEAARRAAEAKRKQDEQLTAIRHRQEQVRAEQEAQRAKLELERAAAEAEAMQRRRVKDAEDAERSQREQREAEILERAERKQAWRRANGGCDPPMRQKCMTVGSSGGGPRQVLGCTCVR